LPVLESFHALYSSAQYTIYQKLLTLTINFGMYSQ